MAYPYIPQIFFIGVFREILAYSCIDPKEDSIKGECCETTHIREQASTDERASLHE